MNTDVFRNQWFADNWVWELSDESPDIMLSQDRRGVYFHVDPVEGSTGTAGESIHDVISLKKGTVHIIIIFI